MECKNFVRNDLIHYEGIIKPHYEIKALRGCTHCLNLIKTCYVATTKIE